MQSTLPIWVIVLGGAVVLAIAGGFWSIIPKDVEKQTDTEVTVVVKLRLVHPCIPFLLFTIVAIVAAVNFVVSYATPNIILLILLVLAAFVLFFAVNMILLAIYVLMMFLRYHTILKKYETKYQSGKVEYEAVPYTTE